MTNLEKHRSAIEEIVFAGKLFGVSKSGEVKPCTDIVGRCKNCILYAGQGKSCMEERHKWLKNECEAPRNTAYMVEVSVVKHGFWKSCRGGLKCSECGKTYPYKFVKDAGYCPKCGARMDGE